jgi:BirA family transcriptional regulator, biotin operon repressor / biotin---[acetyl-CoA-carboxylase] ligase
VSARSTFDALPADLAGTLAASRARLGPFANLRYAAEVDSTNDLAIELASRGAPEGTAVLADAQRAGRGRRGRSWFSPPGAGLYLSVVVRPVGPTDALPLVTLAAGVAAARALRAATGLDVELKWPNDLVAGRPWRKLGGVLCEAVGGGATVDAIVVGIGINLRPAAYPREIADRATSLEGELGRAIDRALVVGEMLAALAEVTGRLWRRERRWICDEWRRLGRAGLAGAVVRWTEHGIAQRGLARDIDDEGGLMVDAGGRAHRLVGGEVFWERLSRE